MLAQMASRSARMASRWAKMAFCSIKATAWSARMAPSPATASPGRLKVVSHRNRMLRQRALWVGTRAPAREKWGEPGCRGGVGEGYYMYILYTENCNPVSTRPEARGLGGLSPRTELQNELGVRAWDFYRVWMKLFSQQK